MLFKSKTIAIAGSIAALSFAAVPIAQAATTTHHPPTQSSLDGSRDASGVHHVDQASDRTSVDRSTTSVDRSTDNRDR
jgi:hypothetical protein